jgi:FdhD protein
MLGSVEHLELTSALFKDRIEVGRPTRMTEIDSIYEDRELLIYKDGVKNSVRHPIVKEAPFTIVLNGEELATLSCSPHSFELLAIGFLVSKGILHKRDDLKDITCRPEQGIVWVDTAAGAARPNGFPRIHHIEQVQPLAHVTRFAVQDLLGWAALLDEEAKTYRLTGGVHEAALAYGESFVASYEDISRHNALDRILGYTFLNEVNTADKAVILSSRISSKMLTKVAQIGVPLVVSRAAPTCLSLDLAEQLGITLVGFARGNSLNVYTHPGRIIE